MSKQLPTYENDKHFTFLLASGMNKDSLLEFIFRKGGKVNVTNLSYLTKGESNKPLLQLASDGKIKFKGSHIAKVTTKARLNRIYKNPSLNFWAIILAVLSILVSVLIY